MRFFPLFVPLEGAAVTVVGGGRVAARRIAVLLDFGCNVTVVSPACLPALERLAAAGRICWIRRGYQLGDCAGARIALLAADDPEANRRAAEEARRAGALVNRADAPEDCDFYFPGIVTRGDAVVGVTSSGRDHRLARRLREQIEAALGPEDTL